MLEKTAISNERLLGRKEAFSILESHKTGISDSELEKEKDFYLNVPISEEKTPAQSDNEAIRSTNALLAIRRKDVEATEQSIIRTAELVEKLKGTTISIQ